MLNVRCSYITKLNYTCHLISVIYTRSLNKSELEQNEKLQQIVNKFNTKLQIKDANIIKVSCIQTLITYSHIVPAVTSITLTRVKGLYEGASDFCVIQYCY